jgi:predicted amidohydrolase
MARHIDLACIHFNMPDSGGEPGRESAMDQWSAACERLDGTGIELVVTCEAMAFVAQGPAEEPARPGPLLQAYADFAVRNRCTVIGSVKLEEDAKVFNAQAMIGPDGAMIGRYRKTYLTAEDIACGFSRGAGAEVVATPAGRIAGVICFDLNFMELCLAYRPLQPDVIAFSSFYHGGHVQASWAYETRAFFAGATADKQSEIRDPLGRVLASANGYTRIARTRINLDRTVVHLDRNQDRFPEIYRAWGPGVRIEVASDLGVALISCERPDRSIADLIREFGLIPLNDYLAPSRTAPDGL